MTATLSHPSTRAAVAGVATAVEPVGLVSENRDLPFPIVPTGRLLVACSGVCALRHGDA